MMPPHTSKKVTFLFPGLGEYTPNMGRVFFDHEPSFRAAILNCVELIDDIIKDGTILNWLYCETAQETDSGLSALINKSNESTNTTTQTIIYSHLATFMLEYAFTRLLREYDIYPQQLLGCSLGEYTACCISGCLSLNDTIQLIIGRAQLIATLPGGKMLAILASQETLVRLLPTDTYLAIIGEPLFNIVAGTHHAIDQLIQILQQEQIFFTPLQVTHPLHTPLMQGLFEPLKHMSEKITKQPCQIPYITNLNGLWITNNQLNNIDYFSLHSCQPILLSQGITQLLQEKSIFFEVGPGTGLSNLTLAIANQLNQKPLIFNLMQHRLIAEDPYAYFLKLIREYHNTLMHEPLE